MVVAAASFEGKCLANSGQGGRVHHPPCRGPEAHGLLRLRQAHLGCWWGYSGAHVVWAEADAQPVVRGHPPPPSRSQILTSGGSLPAVREPRASSAAGSPTSWRRSSGSAEEQVRGERTPRPPAQPMRPVAGKARRGSARPADPLRFPSGPEAERDAKLRPGATGTQERPRRRRRRLCLLSCGGPKAGDARAHGDASARKRRGRLLLVDGEACLPSRCRVPAAAALLRPPLFPQ